MARKLTFCKAGLLAGLVIGVLVGVMDAAAASSQEESTSDLIAEGRALTSFVTQLWSSGALQKPVESARAFFPIGWPTTFLGALAGLTIVGAFKVGLFLVTSFWLLTTAFPTVLAFLGLKSPFLVRSIQEKVPLMKNIDMEVVARSINSLPDKSMEMMQIKGGECRARAICEAGEYVASRVPRLATMAKGILDKIKLTDGYTIAMMRGLSGSGDCGAAFTGCSHSPFKKYTYTSFF